MVEGEWPIPTVSSKFALAMEEALRLSITPNARKSTSISRTAKRLRAQRRSLHDISASGQLPADAFGQSLVICHKIPPDLGMG